MKRTFISIKLLVYYAILLFLLALCIINYSINPIFFSIMIGLLLVLWTFNKFTIVAVGDEIKIIDFYLFLPIVRRKFKVSDIQSINVVKMESEDSLGLSDNVFLDIIIVYVFGFYWSQPQSILNYRLKGNTSEERIKLNLTANSVKKVLD